MTAVKLAESSSAGRNSGWNEGMDVCLGGVHYRLGRSCGVLSGTWGIFLGFCDNPSLECEGEAVVLGASQVESLRIAQNNMVATIHLAEVDRSLGMCGNFRIPTEFKGGCVATGGTLRQDYRYKK